jgi:hypothetical protein
MHHGEKSPSKCAIGCRIFAPAGGGQTKDFIRPMEPVKYE